MKIRQNFCQNSPRMTAFLLLFSMLLPIFTFFPSYAIGETAESTSAELTPIETEEQVFARLTADSQILNYVDEAAFRAAGHVNRLPAEEALNSYVFENEDGTRTAYILAEPVKYKDSAGVVREKNLSFADSNITANAALAQPVDTSAYTVTATDTPMTFPANLSQGVRFTYHNHTITLRPENLRENTSILQVNGKIIYQNAFSNTAHLMYTPTNTGLKEDILLVREGDVNTFSFILNTDGLIPAEDAGGWYLWDGIDISRQIRLGQVISYDANGDFSIGEMTVTPNGGTTYRITLTVDPDFLANVAYPVTVDPSITVSDNVTGNNSIEDIVLFEGAPNACYSSMQYNTVGYAGTTLLEGRTAFRLTGLYNSGAFSSSLNFTNVKFHIYDYSSVAQTVNLFPISMNVDWKENTATWNNIGVYYDGYTCSANIPVNSWGTFDITLLTQQWQDEVHLKETGFILISQNNTVAKKIYSSENTANTARRPYVEATYIYDPQFVFSETMYKDETQKINMHITSYTTSVAWSVADSSVVSINSENMVSSGLSTATITANQLGSTEITATLSLADGNTMTITKSIYVILESGIYFIRNKATLGSPTTANLSSDPYIYCSENFTGADTEKWEIQYVGNNLYTLRSIGSPSHYLGVINNSNTVALFNGPKNWKIEPTSSSAYKIVALESNKTIYANTATTSQPLYQDVYTDDSTYNDEWTLTRMLPLSGYELDYQSEQWCNSFRCNCYGYAINNQIDDNGNEWLKQNPGKYAGIEITPDYYTSEPTALLEVIEQDFEQYNQNFGTNLFFTSIGRYETCPEGSYKVALAIDLYDDYHWYRQDSDGLWSHKNFGFLSSKTDYSGDLIIDPQLADREDYTVFIGYFAVTPWNRYFSQENNQQSIKEISETTDDCIETNVLESM